MKTGRYVTATRPSRSQPSQARPRLRMVQRTRCPRGPAPQGQLPPLFLNLRTPRGRHKGRSPCSNPVGTPLPMVRMPMLWHTDRTGPGLCRVRIGFPMAYRAGQTYNSQPTSHRTASPIGTAGRQWQLRPETHGTLAIRGSSATQETETRGSLAMLRKPGRLIKGASRGLETFPAPTAVRQSMVALANLGMLGVLGNPPVNPRRIERRGPSRPNDPSPRKGRPALLGSGRAHRLMAARTTARDLKTPLHQRPRRRHRPRQTSKDQ